MGKNKKKSGTKDLWTIKVFVKNRIPEIMVLLLCMVVLGTGVSQKQGYHMDELLSFELSNAEFNPWIVPSQPQGRLAKFVEKELRGDSFGETFQNLTATIKDVLQNRGNSRLLSYQADIYEEPVWITAEAFEDYITVDGRDAFNYLSVYFNVKDDNHPPLHFMLLHTMSSFFRRCAEPFVGCVINMAAVAGILILLMWLGNQLANAFGREEQARAAGIFAALCYGLSTGAMATTLLVRMYALLTFFCVALFAIHVKKWSEGGFGQHNKVLIAVTVLGFLTQYFFLFYCLILAAVTGALLFWKKRRKELYVYVRSMVTAAVTGVVLFPFSISDVFSSGRGVEALDNLSEGLHGFGSRLAAFAGILSGRTFGEVLLLALLLSGIVTLLWKISLRKKAKRAIKSGECGSLLFLLLFPAAGYFLLAARMSPYLVDRYLMPVFPFVALAGALLIIWLVAAAVKESGRMVTVPVVCMIVVLWQAGGLVRYDGSYLYTGYGLQRAMAEENAQYPCICVYDGVGYYENLLEFTSYEKTLLVTTEELADRKDTESVTSLEHVVLLLKANVDAERVLDIMEEKYGFFAEEYLIRGTGVHGDQILLLGKGQDQM